MDSVEKQTDRLGEESLHNIKTETNKLTGDIEVSSDKFLVFSIPYNAGFTAYVDGKKAKLVQANSMYMGVELTYCTPYVIPGMYLSVSGLFLFLMIGIFYRRPKKQRERGNQEK